MRQVADLHWKPTASAVLENPRYGSIRHRVNFSPDGGSLFDFPHFIEPGGAAMLPITSDGEIGLVKIERAALLKENPSGTFPDFPPADFGRVVWESPRGFRKIGEPIEQTAFREFADEAGVEIRQLAHVGNVATNSAVMATPIDLFLGWIEPTNRPRKTKEGVLSFETMPLARVRELIESGELICSVTLSLICRALLDGKITP